MVRGTTTLCEHWFNRCVLMFWGMVTYCVLSLRNRCSIRVCVISSFVTVFLHHCSRQWGDCLGLFTFIFPAKKLACSWAFSLLLVSVAIVQSGPVRGGIVLVTYLPVNPYQRTTKSYFPSPTHTACVSAFFSTSLMPNYLSWSFYCRLLLLLFPLRWYEYHPYYYWC